MHTVMWTFKVPAGTSKQDLVNTINATAHTYQGIPGLIRKYYGIVLYESGQEARALDYLRPIADADQSIPDG